MQDRRIHLCNRCFVKGADPNVCTACGHKIGEEVKCQSTSTVTSAKKDNSTKAVNVWSARSKNGMIRTLTTQTFVM